MIRVKDLPTLGDKSAARPFLFCDECLAEFSAKPDDYFMAKPETRMRCRCGRDLRLVTRHTTYQDFRPVKAVDHSTDYVPSKRRIL